MTPYVAINCTSPLSEGARYFPFPHNLFPLRFLCAPGRAINRLSEASDTTTGAWSSRTEEPDITTRNSHGVGITGVLI